MHTYVSTNICTYFHTYHIAPNKSKKYSLFHIIAIQMWTLARYLPIIVGSYVPNDDEHWQNFLTLLDMTDYLVAPYLSTDEAAHLKVIIEDHHMQLYPDSSIIIKMHYLTHYPRFICK